MDRKTIQDLYIRVCRDSGFKMECIEAAKLTGRIIKASPIEVWCAFSGLDVIEKIAAGTHPALRL